MEVKIEKLVYGGEGLGHADGCTVFVPFVMPGEVVEVEAREKKKKFARGRLRRVVTASEGRIAAACPHFAVCGGCDYQHIPYAQQVEFKTEILRETLWRLGRVKWEGEIPTHASPAWGYRNRAQWKVRPIGKNGGGALGIGYFQAGTSALCAVQECSVLSPRLAEAMTGLRAKLEEGGLPATLREIEAFADARDESVLLTASLTEFGKEKRELAAKLREAAPGATSVLLHESSRDRFELDGPGTLEYEAAGAKLRVGHLSFFQVNRFLVDEMVKVATEGESGGLAVDLFAGVGLFTVALAEKFERVIGVEANPAAARDLSVNLEAAGLGKERAQAISVDAEKWLAASGERPELVVLDPPRAGVEAEALERLMEMGPKRVVYMSCDASTLARDLGKLAGEGEKYEIAEMRMLDVFPQTYHIEAVVKLKRR